LVSNFAHVFRIIVFDVGSACASLSRSATRSERHLSNSST
jgi:hypothetical protein